MASRGFLVGDHSIRPRRPVRYVANKQATKTTKRKKKKPEWDNTINDLNVHKATKEEQAKRHELHKSKNTTKIHLQRQLKDQSLDSTTQTPDTVERRKLAIVQEVLYGHDKLQDVLSESDKAMSVVKDLFGDDPKKFMGFPNVTAAPSNALLGKENRFLAGPVAEPPETPTHLSLLSDSVMRTPALNELSDDHEEGDDSPPGTPTGHEKKQTSSSFQPKLDLQRFQQYVAQEQSRYVEPESQPLLNGHGSGHVAPHGHTTDQVEPYGHGTHHGTDHVAPYGSMHAGADKPWDNHNMHPKASQPYVHPQAAAPSTAGAKIKDDSSGAFSSGRGSDHVTPQSTMASETSQPSSFLSQDSAEIIAGWPNFVMPVSTGETSAGSSIPPDVRPSSRNAKADQQGTGKTKKTTKTSHKPPSNSSSSGLRSLDDLKKMVEELENEIAAYEAETGRQQTNLSTVSNSFSGYTASLITAVTKLMSYLKESEIQRKAEMVMREQVLHGFEEQRVLVDALTNDILHTQEQNLALQHQLLEYKKTTDEQLQYLKRELFTVLRSYEYQALSSNINTLYSLNPVALNQGSFNVLPPRLDENHNLEYLPGAPQAHNGREQEMIGNGRGNDLVTQASFIPLATSHGQGIPQYPSMHRAETSQVSQGSQITQGHIELAHTYGDTKTGHGQIGSNILMYPPSQGPNMQVDNIAKPHMSTAASKSVGQPATSTAPQVRSEAVSPNGNVGYSAMSAVPLVRNEPASLRSAGGQPATFTAAPVRTEAVSLSSMVGQPATFTAATVRTEAVSFSSMVGQPATFTAAPVRTEAVSFSSMVGQPATFTAAPVRTETVSLSSMVGQPATFTAATVRTEAVSFSSMVGQPATFTAAPVRTEAVSLSSMVGQPATFTAAPVRTEAVSFSSMVGQPATFTAAPVRTEAVSFSSMVGQPATFTAAPVRTEAVSFSSMVGQPATFTAAPVRTEAVSLSSMVGQPATLTTPLQVRSESALLRSTGMPTAHFLYSPYQHLPGQVDSNVQARVKPDHPVSRSTEPPSISRGIPTLQAAPIRSLQTMPCAAPSEPTTTRQLGSATQAATSDMPQQHQQPLQQVQSQPTAKLEQPSKSRGFVLVSKGMTVGLPAGHQLRERLQNLANRQKSLAAKNSEQDVGSVSSILQSRGGTKEVQQARPTSPHVHFKDPPVALSRHDSSKEQQKQSPPVSPIPFKNAAAPRPTAPPDKRVVVNLPNAWSDVSSTISL